MTVDASGVHAGPGLTPTPIAHGYIEGTAGSRMSGSSNLTCTWVQASLWYACTIAGQDFFYAYYTVSVTPTAAVVATTGSVGGQLIVQFFNLTGAAVKPSGGFSVVVYKQ